VPPPELVGFWLRFHLCCNICARRGIEACDVDRLPAGLVHAGNSHWVFARNADAVRACVLAMQKEDIAAAKQLKTELSAASASSHSVRPEATTRAFLSRLQLPSDATGAGAAAARKPVNDVEPPQCLRFPYVSIHFIFGSYHDKRCLDQTVC
jgi:hypothetical protein